MFHAIGSLYVFMAWGLGTGEELHYLYSSANIVSSEMRVGEKCSVSRNKVQ